MKLSSLLLLVPVLMLLMSSFVHADVDANEKYCYLMVTIYGACSPELVANYLKMTAPQPYVAPRVIPQVKPSYAIVSSTISTLPQTDLKTEPNVRYTWYWNNVRWVRGRLVA